MQKTDIEWCDCTVNPVVGCSNNCAYCYARRMNSRFKFVEDFSVPHYLPERLKEIYNAKTAKSIFINSMSDISQWSGVALIALSKAIEDNPQHNFIALTKNVALYQSKYSALQAKRYRLTGLDKLHLGITVTRAADFDKAGILFKTSFLNLEPILEPIDVAPILNQAKIMKTSIEAVIIGAETGGRKNRVKPDKVWIDDITAAADGRGIAVFMKESLHEIMGADFRQDRLIWAKTVELKAKLSNKGC